MPDVYIKPRGENLKTSDCIALAVELGEFRAFSGCGFDVAWTALDHTLKITYWQDETFTALRLKFGHQFVPDPTQTKRVPNRPLPVPPQKKKACLPDWISNPKPRRERDSDFEKLLWKIAESEQESPNETLDRRYRAKKAMLLSD